MNTQTQEALKMAIELIEMYEDKLDSVFAAKVLKSCMEALAQPLTRDWKETIDERIAKDDMFKEAFAQPAQEPVAVCKDSIVNWVNGKAIDGWLYTHPAPEQNEFARTKSWQGLSDGQILDKAAQIMVERHYKDKNK